jgi:hypothetical protein
MQQIADWLEKLGLGQYAQRFAENGIDVPSDLTDQGVVLGDRRKMLRATRQTRRNPGRSPASGSRKLPTTDFDAQLALALSTALCV